MLYWPLLGVMNGLILQAFYVTVAPIKVLYLCSKAPALSLRFHEIHLASLPGRSGTKSNSAA